VQIYDILGILFEKNDTFVKQEKEIST